MNATISRRGSRPKSISSLPDAIVTLYLSVPHRFHPRYSLLGRWIGARVQDARQAEGAYMFAVGVVLLLILILQNLAWGVLAPLDDPDARAGFWLVQFVGMVLFAGVCLIGFRPGFVVREEAEALVIEQAGEVTHLPLAAIKRVDEVPYLTVHRHYGRYGRTRSWVDRSAGPVLLIETREAPIVLGLSPESHAAVKERLLCRMGEWRTEVAAGVA